VSPAPNRRNVTLPALNRSNVTFLRFRGAPQWSGSWPIATAPVGVISPVHAHAVQEQ
jgi:hypothetical protein